MVKANELGGGVIYPHFTEKNQSPGREDVLTKKAVELDENVGFLTSSPVLLPCLWFSLFPNFTGSPNLNSLLS